MLYVEDSVGSAYLPKLLGIYERETAGCIESICRQAPDVIVDVGAAEGYFAVGLARRNPQAEVIAFEMDAAGRESLRRTAHSNGVLDRIRIRGRCEPGELASVLDGAGRPAVICDVEGYELSLLDPATVPALVRASILAEVHEFVVPGIGAQLLARFAGTHRVEQIWAAPRTREDFPWRTAATALLPRSYLDWAVSEWRPPGMSWLWMEPRCTA
jgi:hypothetical protein